MSELRTLQFEEIFSYLAEEMDTLILFHRNPDADATGSAFALRRIMELMGSRAWCVCESEVPARLRFLMNGEQDSTLPESIPADFEVRRIITVDTASPAQMGALWEIYGGQIDLMIDHHGKGEPYADHYVDPNAAATGEIIFDLIKGLEGSEQLLQDEEICTALYAAISADTGSFRYSNVTPHTHLRVAELVASGIDCAAINHLLYETKTVEQLRAQAAGISNLHLFADGRVAVITFPYALKMALALEDVHLENLVDVARSIGGVKVAIAIRQPGAAGVFRVSMRSSCAYDVAELCATFEGGGHAKAAGCTLTAADMDEAMNKIVNSIREDDLI